ncbi:MAG: hypothetical protein AAGA06_01340 [Pseudomonadota bacterium]
MGLAEMVHLGATESATLISEWFENQHLTRTELRVERLEADYPEEPHHRAFQFRPSRLGCFDLNIIVSGDGYWGAGIMHPEHSSRVYAWGFEGTTMSHEAVLRLARYIAEGQTEIVVPKFELSRSVGWLELSQHALDELSNRPHRDRIRSKTKTRFYQKRIRSKAWQ